MQTTWQGHTIKITGNWIARYLFLAPQYELWLDDNRLDATGGPRMRPRLEAIVEAHDDTEQEDEDPTRFHIEAHVLSIAGFRPVCELCVDGQVVHTERIKVQNVLNPFLVLFILATTSWMLYVGPDMLRTILNR